MEFLCEFTVDKDDSEKMWSARHGFLAMQERSVSVSHEEAVKMHVEKDFWFEFIYKKVSSQLEKVGFDFRRGDNIDFARHWTNPTRIFVWWEKGDHDVPETKAGFGSKK